MSRGKYKIRTRLAKWKNDCGSISLGGGEPAGTLGLIK